MQGIRSHPSGLSAQSNLPASSGPKSSNLPVRSRLPTQVYRKGNPWSVFYCIFSSTRHNAVSPEM